MYVATSLCTGRWSNTCTSAFPCTWQKLQALPRLGVTNHPHGLHFHEDSVRVDGSRDEDMCEDVWTFRSRTPRLLGCLLSPLMARTPTSPSRCWPLSVGELARDKWHWMKPCVCVCAGGAPERRDADAEGLLHRSIPPKRRRSSVCGVMQVASEVLDSMLLVRLPKAKERWSACIRCFVCGCVALLLLQRVVHPGHLSIHIHLTHSKPPHLAVL